MHPNVIAKIPPSPLRRSISLYCLSDALRPLQNDELDDMDAHPSKPESVGERIEEGDDLSKGKFNVEVVSVFYYAEEETCRAAVVLKTSFDLKDGRKLKYAMCPVAVRPLSKNPQNLHIVGYYPEKQEFVQVAYIPGTKEWTLDPRITIPNAADLGFGSLKESRNNDKVRVISLNATTHQDRDQHHIEWTYKDEQKSYYPDSVHLLVTVQHFEPTPWFQFELRVMEKLKIDVHSRDSKFTKLWDRLLRVLGRSVTGFLGRSATGDGWGFKIRGRYNEDIPRKALRSIESESYGPTVGLKAAAKEMIPALARPSGR